MRLLRMRRRARSVAHVVLCGHLVGIDYGRGQVPCIYAETKNGSPVYVTVARWQAQFLAEALAKAASGRDSAWWNEPQAVELSRT